VVESYALSSSRVRLARPSNEFAHLPLYGEEPRLNPYTDTLWGELKTVALPVNHIFDRDGNIELTRSDLSTFAYCCLQANRLHSNCAFTAPVRKLEPATGYSHAQLERSLRSLQKNNLIKRLPGPLFEDAKYAIATKFTGIALAELFADDRDGRRTPSLRTVLRNAKLIYFSVPKITLQKLPALKGPPLAALLSLIKYAGELREPDFSINLQQWRKMSGIAGNETLRAACANFEDTVSIHFESGAHHATASLLNPETGREIADEQYERVLAKERVQVNNPYTRDELEAWFKSEFPDAIPNGNDLIVYCPRCKEIHPNKRRPTLRYDAGKGVWGVFYCDECRYGKGVTPIHLMAEIKCLDERQAQRQIEKFIETRSKAEASMTNVREAAAVAKATS
jgi:hypothetical protein